MTAGLPLLDWYPRTPGWKKTDTSRAAAADMQGKAATVRAAVTAQLITGGPMTADECAEVLGLSILTVRPRFSELRNMGRIADTGERRQNGSGKKAIVWRMADGSEG